MEVGVKGLAFLSAGFHVVFVQDLAELLEDQFDALVRVFLGGAPLQIVQHRQKRGHGGHLRLLPGGFLLLHGALAEVVVLRQDALVAFLLPGGFLLHLPELFLQLFAVLFLLFALAGGLFGPGRSGFSLSGRRFGLRCGLCRGLCFTLRFGLRFHFFGHRSHLRPLVVSFHFR